MVREILIGAGGVIIVAAIIAAVKYKMEHKDDGEIESVFVDELNMGEIKKWFVEKMANDSMKGIVFLPTKENVDKWKVKMPQQDNVLIQLIYDEANDKVIAYREVGYAEISEKVKELLDTNGGTLVIEK